MGCQMNQPASNFCSNVQQPCKIINEMMQDISYLEFKQMLDAYVQVAASQLRSADWFDNRKPSKIFLEPDLSQYQLIGEHDISSHFVPFIQKLVIKPESKIITVGDIHGDLDALRAILNELMQAGYLDSDLKLVRDNVYIVFLGDYVNRGSDSISVMYLLSKLAVTNPGRVVLIRGNHEYASTSKYFHKRFVEQQEQTSAHHAKTTLLEELSERFSRYTYPDFLYWFDYLPMVLYLGTPGEKGSVNYVKFCHAGLELGYNPNEFLASNASYFVLDKIDRRQALEDLVLELSHVSTAVDLARAAAHSAAAESPATQELYFKAEPVDFSEPTSPYHVRLGFQWDNFLTQDNDAIDFALSVERRRIFLGKNITKHLLAQRSGHTVAVRSVIRGHQHLDEMIPELGLDSPMLSQIRQHAGVVKQWNGMVYTLGASDAITGYHSFIMVQTNEDLKKWSLRHYFKKPEQIIFTMRMSSMFDE